MKQTTHYPGHGSPQSRPSLHILFLPSAYPGSLLSTGSRKTRKSQGPLVKTGKEKLRHEKREGPKKGQRRSGEVMESVVWETWALPRTRWLWTNSYCSLSLLPPLWNRVG